ncbi:MAG: hypothetical protein GY774_11360 [Planctomycetes bacterium]|nr:hypothetical protein [Planctomycetota bacterium]
MVYHPPERLPAAAGWRKAVRNPPFIWSPRLMGHAPLLRRWLTVALQPHLTLMQHAFALRKAL